MKTKKPAAIVKPLEKVDRLFENFASELVTVVLDKDVEFSKQTEESVETTKTPLSTIGFLTDLDDNFLYLGHEPNAIHQAIRREYIIHIEATEIVEEEQEDKLTAVQTPKNTKGYN